MHLRVQNQPSLHRKSQASQIYGLNVSVSKQHKTLNNTHKKNCWYLVFIPWCAASTVLDCKWRQVYAAFRGFDMSLGDRAQALMLARAISPTLPYVTSKLCLRSSLLQQVKMFDLVEKVGYVGYRHTLE